MYFYQTKAHDVKHDKKRHAEADDRRVQVFQQKVIERRSLDLSVLFHAQLCNIMKNDMKDYIYDFYVGRGNFFILLYWKYNEQL
jgi:hypothetical protein